MITHETPWDFNPEKYSPDMSQKIVYEDMWEIAMGAPVAGNSKLINPLGTFSINKFCGGPPAWDTDGTMVAIPLWQDTFWRRFQRMAILDTDKMELTIFNKSFDVIDIRSFHDHVIYGYDSPIHKTKIIEFDINKEKILKVVKLKLH